MPSNRYRTQKKSESISRPEKPKDSGAKKGQVDDHDEEEDAGMVERDEDEEIVLELRRCTGDEARDDVVEVDEGTPALRRAFLDLPVSRLWMLLVLLGDGYNGCW